MICSGKSLDGPPCADPPVLPILVRDFLTRYRKLLVDFILPTWNNCILFFFTLLFPNNRVHCCVKRTIVMSLRS